MQMEMRLKLTAWAILALGSFASIATLLRIIYEIEGIGKTNAEMDPLKAFLWYLIEVGVSLVCTSAATLQPLLISWKIIGTGVDSSDDEHDMKLPRFEQAKAYLVQTLRPVDSSTKSLRAARTEDEEDEITNISKPGGMWLDKHGEVRRWH